ncbi:MAG: DUF3137 domain-containing protein [Clostridiaceae bacterium]|nr:DUF3137 domain-containing protein [Clostridiaceae bacterium]
MTMEKTFNQGGTASASAGDSGLLRQLKSLKKTVLLGRILAIVLPVAGFALVAFIAMQEEWIWMLVAILVLLLLWIANALRLKSRSRKLKTLLGQSITMPVLQEFFEVHEYLPDKGIDERIIYSAGLVESWDRYSGSDLLRGKYRGLNILYSDIHLEREETDTDSEGSTTTHYVTVFRGQWMICDFRKQLPATLHLKAKGRSQLFKPKSDIETENDAFNKRYQIKTGDGHTAFYVLTPHFMEYIMQAGDIANAPTSFCFAGSQVHIAIDSRHDSLELKRVKLDSVDNIRNKFRSELKYVTDILDLLLLNENIY